MDQQVDWYKKPALTMLWEAVHDLPKTDRSPVNIALVFGCVVAIAVLRPFIARLK